MKKECRGLGSNWKCSVRSRLRDSSRGAVRVLPRTDSTGNHRGEEEKGMVESGQDRADLWGAYWYR